MIAATMLPLNYSTAIYLAGALLVVLGGTGAIWLAATSQRRESLTATSTLSKLVYASFATSIVILAASSFYGVLIEGVMQHWALLAHMGGAGAFVFLLAVFALTYSPSRSVDDLLEQTMDQSINRWWLARWSLWVLLISGLISAMTMLLSMLPLLSTESMEISVAVHRYSGLICASALLVNLYSAIWLRLGVR